MYLEGGVVHILPMHSTVLADNFSAVYWGWDLLLANGQDGEAKPDSMKPHPSHMHRKISISLNLLS